MKKPALLVLIGIIVFGSFALYYTFFRVPSQNGNDIQASQETTEQNTKEVITGSPDSISGKISDLLAAGKDYACEYSYSDENGNISFGNVYITQSGSKMAGNFVFIDENNKKVITDFVKDGSTIYSWSSDFEQGIKITQDTVDTMFPDLQTDQDSFLDSENDFVKTYITQLTQETDYQCRSWNVDDALFEIPSNIQFIDPVESLNSFVESFNESNANSSDVFIGNDEINYCTLCEQIPEGSAKDQCLKSYSC